ncbi:MAG TPA: sigma 54-interacting transcriptional regulator, partial [Blastocatellia bacterium]|nr:sigma 54-interacting transcriptional regulator [Blastocatellia bacterium]
QESESGIRLRQYQALCEVAESISTHRDMASLLGELKERLQIVVRFDALQIVLHDAERNLMRRHILESPAPPREDPLTELPIEDAPAGWVWQTQEPMLISELAAYEDRFPRVIAELRQYGVKTVYILPLTSRNRRLGALGFISRQESAWSEDDQELLGHVTKLVAVALDNTINFESAHATANELKQQFERERLMLEINNAVVSRLDLPSLLTAISESLRRVLPQDFVGMALYDAEIDQLRVQALDYARNLEIFGTTTLIPLKGTGSGKAFTSRKTVLLRRFGPAESPVEAVRQIVAAGLKSSCHVPLISRERALGTLDVMSSREDAFTEDDAEMLTQIAGQIAIAVENVLNLERAREAEQEARRKADYLSLVLEINNAIVSQLSLLELVRVTSSRLREVLGHDLTGLSLYDPDTNQFRAYMFDMPDSMAAIEPGTTMPLEGSVGGMAFMSGQPVFMSRPDPEILSSEFDRRLTEAGIRSGGVVPLISHNRKLGFLGVGSFREDAFSKADQELLCHIANQIAIAVENALAYREIETLKNKLASEKLYLEDEIRTEHNFEELIGVSPSFRRILKQVETVAPTDSTVLIRGETGTGKELLARALHNLSLRRDRTLVKINCAAIPTGLLEAELFGHEKGAFTGAISQRIGRFELANKGTLFLDEVGDIPLELQPKLLRVLQEQEFERLGSTRTQRVDVRLIAATNSDLEQMVADKKYRSDLYYRLNVFPITIPPLRERAEDIPALARFFTQKYARRLKKSIESIPAEAMAALKGYSWPGNVRELEHFIERAVILTQGAELEVSVSELKSPAQSFPESISTLEAAEREHILRALEATNWVIGGPNGAAARLGMKRTTLQYRIQKLGLERGGS